MDSAQHLASWRVQATIVFRTSAVTDAERNEPNRRLAYVFGSQARPDSVVIDKLISAGDENGRRLIQNPALSRTGRRPRAEHAIPGKRADQAFDRSQDKTVADVNDLRARARRHEIRRES